MSQLQKNKQAAKELLELLYDSNKTSEERSAGITNYINPNKYIQHSPTLDNGYQTLLDLSDKFAQENDTFSVDVVIGTGSGMQWGAFDCSEVYSKVFFTK